MENNIVAPCLLYTHSLCSLLVWSGSYMKDDDIKTSITYFYSHRPNDVPNKVVNSEGMGYRQHLRKG